MIIVNQDKTEIINFDNVKGVWIDSEEKDKFTIEATSDTNTSLGTYTTEERAKEILQEVVKEYSSYLELRGGPAIFQGDVAVQPNIFNIPKVYYMPEE